MLAQSPESVISKQEQDDISISENCLCELLGTTSSWLEGEKVSSHISTNRSFFCSFVWGCKILTCHSCSLPVWGSPQVPSEAGRCYVGL